MDPKSNAVQVESPYGTWVVMPFGMGLELFCENEDIDEEYGNEFVFRDVNAFGDEVKRICDVVKYLRAETRVRSLEIIEGAMEEERSCAFCLFIVCADASQNLIALPPDGTYDKKKAIRYFIEEYAPDKKAIFYYIVVSGKTIVEHSGFKDSIRQLNFVSESDINYAYGAIYTEVQSEDYVGQWLTVVFMTGKHIWLSDEISLGDADMSGLPAFFEHTDIDFDI